LKADALLVEKELLNKPNKNEVVHLDVIENHISNMKDAVVFIKNELSLKCNVKDICKLLDLKANLKYVDDNIGNIMDELKRKVGNNDYDEFKRRSLISIDTLLSEYNVARFS